MRKIEVGSVLTYSWGYDQTNVDAFQVTRATTASVWIRPIALRQTEGLTGMSDSCAPVPNKFLRRCPQCDRESTDTRCYRCDVDTVLPAAIRKLRKVNTWAKRPEDEEEYLAMEFGSARLWAGGSTYRSWYA